MKRLAAHYSICQGFDHEGPSLWVKRPDGSHGSNAKAMTMRRAMTWARRFGPGAIIIRYSRRKHRREVEFTYLGSVGPIIGNPVGLLPSTGS